MGLIPGKCYTVDNLFPITIMRKTGTKDLFMAYYVQDTLTINRLNFDSIKSCVPEDASLTQRLCTDVTANFYVLQKGDFIITTVDDGVMVFGVVIDPEEQTIYALIPWARIEPIKEDVFDEIFNTIVLEPDCVPEDYRELYQECLEKLKCL